VEGFHPVMTSYYTITLFSERPELSRRSSSFVVSILVHGAVIGLISYGLLFQPQVRSRVVTERFTLRQLDMHMPEPLVARSAGGIRYPGPYHPAHALLSGGRPAAQQTLLRQLEQAPPGPQTLLQPNLRSLMKLARATPVPTVVLWSPEKTPVKTIVPPQPDKPTAAEVHPSPDPPNQEVNLADIRISSTDLVKEGRPILPSTTSPVVVHGPDLPQKIPATTSTSTAQPTPAAVLALSNLHMAEGTVMLPPVNETVASNSPGALTQGEAKSAVESGNNSPTGVVGGTGAGPGAGESKGQGSGDSREQGAWDSKGQPNHTGSAGAKGAGQGAGESKGQSKLTAVAGKPNGAKTGPAQGSETGSEIGSGQGDKSSTVHITLPKDGQFSAVVVGASLEAKYPESAGLWNGRLAYTVYLHLGLAKSWIFQYSLPRSDDAASAGASTHLEAPWPYNIVRPNIAPEDLNADALMVHGFVNRAGRFEGLTILFPPEFPQTQFVLDALAQWQFRPATQNGQSARVEVLLIIPDIE